MNNTQVTNTNQAKPVGAKVPAYMAVNPQATTMDSSSNANLSIFANPVEGNVDTGVTHDGDLGGAG